MADDDSDTFVQVMETFQNIGPILDMSVVDLDKQGQDLVRVCVYLRVHTMLHIYVHNTCVHPHHLSLSLALSLSLSLSLFLSLSSLQIVSCSHCGKDQVILSGIGINEAASIDLAGVKGEFTIQVHAV